MKLIYLVLAMGLTTQAQTNYHFSGCAYDKNVADQAVFEVPVSAMTRPSPTCNGGNNEIACRARVICRNVEGNSALNGVSLGSTCKGEIGADKLPHCPKVADTCANDKVVAEWYGVSAPFYARGNPPEHYRPLPTSNESESR